MQMLNLCFLDSNTPNSQTCEKSYIYAPRMVIMTLELPRQYANGLDIGVIDKMKLMNIKIYRRV